MSEFKEHTKGQDENSIWYHYLFENVNKNVAKCKKCGKQIKCAGGSTSGLHTHLKTNHNIDTRKRKECVAKNDQGSSGSSQSVTVKHSNSITKYLKIEKKDTLSEILARMTARDGLPFSIICTSIEIRKGLSARNFNDIPVSPNTIRNMVIEYGKKIQSLLVIKLNDMKKNGHKFSLTFDEWTSLKNRRYLNINIHFKNNEFENLGLVRVYGCLPAEKCIELVDQKLKEYGLSISKDIVCITTDGAAIMTKVGRLIEAEQQLCYSHGIHLAVIDVLYNKSIIEQHEEYEDNNSDNNDSDTDNEDGMIVESVSNQNCQSLNHKDLSPLIQKVRKTIKKFKRSPTKNDEYLQKYVKAEFGKELSLQLDSKTRWNSLLSMLERFYHLRHCIQKALIDISSNISFQESEFQLISSTINALTPIKLAVEALCRKEANLLSANATFKFMLTSLKAQNSEICKELHTALTLRLYQRFNKHSQLLNYLHAGYQDVTDISPALKKDVIINLITNLVTRLGIEKQEQPLEDINVTNIENDMQLTETKTLEEKLNLAILEKMSSLPKSKITNRLEVSIKKEIRFFEEEGIRGHYLKSVYDFLLTIPPTSVESERVFSLANSICTKIRTRLNDETIDILCFLRSHFINNEG